MATMSATAWAIVRLVIVAAACAVHIVVAALASIATD
jgi:hypothetical protein